MVLNEWAPTTETGEDLLAILLSPSQPLVFAPQVHSEPSEVLRAEANALPADIILNEWAPSTEMGEDLFCMVLSPSWPLALAPQVHSEPSEVLRAKEEPI